MVKLNRYARTSALPAIAAALALSSTPLLAQEAPQTVPQQATPTDTAPPTVAPVAPPAPVTESAPAATDTAAAPADEVAPAATSSKRTTHKVAARAKTVRPAVAAASTRVTPRPAAAAKPAATTARPVPAAAPAPVSQRPKPVVDLNAKSSSTSTTTAAASKPKKKNEALPIAGGALAFLAIGGAAVAMTRKRDDEEVWDDEAAAYEPEVAEAPVAAEPVIHEEQPAILAPAAFAWEDGREKEPMVNRKDGETHVERAYRGPSPENPSLSLRKRLKRAAFLDKREREAAAGEAVPIDASAGLPERFVEEQREGEFEQA